MYPANHVQAVRITRSHLCPAYGLTLAAYAGKTKPLDFFYLLLEFMLWAFVVRSTGCTINDIFDRNIDRRISEY